MAKQAREHRRPKYAEDVKAGMARLKGLSRSDLEKDDKRGPSSPLGKRKEKGR
jgi:hypothetical protein